MDREDVKRSIFRGSPRPMSSRGRGRSFVPKTGGREDTSRRALPDPSVPPRSPCPFCGAWDHWKVYCPTRTPARGRPARPPPAWYSSERSRNGDPDTHRQDRRRDERRDEHHKDERGKDVRRMDRDHRDERPRADRSGRPAAARETNDHGHKREHPVESVESNSDRNKRPRVSNGVDMRVQSRDTRAERMPPTSSRQTQRAVSPEIKVEEISDPTPETSKRRSASKSVHSESRPENVRATNGRQNEPDRRLSDALDGLFSQHENLANTTTDMPRTKDKPAARQSTDSSTSDDSSSDSDIDLPSIAQLALQIERQRNKFRIYSAKARRASKRLNRLTKRLGKVATTTIDPPPALSNGSSPKSASFQSQPSSSSSTSKPSCAFTAAPIDTSPKGSDVPLSIRRSEPKWQVKSQNAFDVLYNCTWVKGGDLKRKPRSLLLPPDNGGSLSDTVMASTLDGQLHVFDRKHRSHVHTIPYEDLLNYWPEDMSWISPNVLCVAAADKSCHATDKTVVNHQLALIYDCSVRKKQFQYKVKRLTNNMPHDKGVTVIYPFSLSGRQTRWLTGGMDKKLFLWSFEGQFQVDGEEYTRVQHIHVHTEHKSSIHAIYYNSSSGILYSGGQDCRLIGWSLDKQTNVLPSARQEGRIRDITGVPTQPNLMLMGFAEQKKQLRLWDERTGNYVLDLGITEVPVDEPVRADTSRYMHASIHPEGYLVSMGHARNGTVSIWDMRYTGVDKAPTQYLDGHSKRVIVAKFDQSRGKESLISVSHDNTLMFMDYHMRRNATPDYPLRAC